MMTERRSAAAGEDAPNVPASARRRLPRSPGPGRDHRGPGHRAAHAVSDRQPAAGEREQSPVRRASKGPATTFTRRTSPVKTVTAMKEPPTDGDGRYPLPITNAMLLPAKPAHQQAALRQRNWTLRLARRAVRQGRGSSPRRRRPSPTATPPPSKPTTTRSIRRPRPRHGAAAADPD